WPCGLVALTLAESWCDHGLFFLTAAVTGQVALEQHIREVAVREGDGVTFQCSMSGDRMSSYNMFWYRQGPHHSLDWIYREGDGRGGSYSHTAPFARQRFSGQADKSSGTLIITGLELGDSAVYYCALQGPQ
uniref:Ig-like domain-containing protein n=1 Tax=Athene cunicularia TaxID=194338 RepID=A0A663MYT1_ATHCN